MELISMNLTNRLIFNKLTVVFTVSRVSSR
ncbi:hypothetical protein PAE9249_05318 [Paenibacillus sp. CECT 9249]|nr:hypothetical protein PAE9249_05318 [Paenibacillus sp. CECT 9249]